MQASAGAANSSEFPQPHELYTRARATRRQSQLLIERYRAAQRDATEILIISAACRRAEQVPRIAQGYVQPAPSLTRSELRILQLMATSTNRQIAGGLYISHNTVRTHLRSIYRKLGVSSRAQALERAADLHLL